MACHCSNLAQRCRSKTVALCDCKSDRSRPNYVRSHSSTGLAACKTLESAKSAAKSAVTRRTHSRATEVDRIDRRSRSKQLGRPQPPRPAALELTRVSAATRVDTHRHRPCAHRCQTSLLCISSASAPQNVCSPSRPPRARCATCDGTKRMTRSGAACCARNGRARARCCAHSGRGRPRASSSERSPRSETRGRKLCGDRSVWS